MKTIPRTSGWPTRGARSGASSPSRFGISGFPGIHGLADQAHVLRLQALLPAHRLELHGRALGKRAQAVRLDRVVVDEHVVAPLHANEPEALGFVVELHDALHVVSFTRRGPGM